MRKNNRTKKHREGFTLIEIIVTLVITSIMASLLFSFMSSAVSNAPLPVVRMDDHYQVTAVMEAVTREYHMLMHSDAHRATALADLNTAITNGDFNVTGGPTATAAWSSLDTINFPGSTLLQVTVTLGDQSVTALFPST